VGLGLSPTHISGLSLKPNKPGHMGGPSPNPELRAFLARPIFSLRNKALFGSLGGVCQTHS